MPPIFPPKLKPGDHVRVVAPARSLALIPPAQRELSVARFRDLGLSMSYAKHAEERDLFSSSSLESRVADLHDAFRDPKVNAISTVIGGFNSNQLLKYLDYELIRANPKILCGYSDITALQNAILARADLVTYSGPHFSTFAMQRRFEFTLAHFQRCLFESGPFELKPSTHWSDDPWFLDQEQRDFVPNPGYLVVHRGKARGRIIGGNLCTFNLLQGTEFRPSLEGSILFLEDDEAAGAMTDVEVDRNLQSILHLPDFGGVRGIVFGRFQRRSAMSEEKLRHIIGTKRELRDLPVVANVDFGHTDPYLTFPIGGTAELDGAAIRIVEH